MEKSFIVIILMLILTEGYATKVENKSINKNLNDGTQRHELAKPDNYYCKFKKKNGTIELAKNCSLIDGKQIITTCSGITCIANSTVESVSRNHCNDGGSGGTTFSKATGGSFKGGEKFLEDFFINVKKFCDNGFKISDADKIKKNISYLNKYTISNWLILELPKDDATKNVMDVISNNQCFLDAFQQLDFDYVKVSVGEKQWFNVRQNKYEKLEDIYRPCEP